MTVVTSDNTEWRLHSVLLANRSEFFYKALTADFAEKRTRRIELGFDIPLEAWPVLIDYFYSDTIVISESNVIGLLALARQLLVTTVDGYCMDFIHQKLNIDNCFQYLRESVKYSIHDLQRDCVKLAAKGFHFLYATDTSGLPPSAILDILKSEELVVDCEVQVLDFVKRYLLSTQVDEDSVLSICGQVRFAYLDNQTLATLGRCGVVPKSLVLEGALRRVEYQDRPDLDLACLPEPPRPTYTSNWNYGLPGGVTYRDIDLDVIWDQLCKCCAVRVSGVSEGSPDNVLSSDAEAWFETNDSAESPPWVEVRMPANLSVVNFTRYSFSHGHRRSGYFRMRNWKTQVGEHGDGPFQDVTTRYSPAAPDIRVYTPEPFEMLVSGAQPLRPWRVVRLVATGCQEDGVHRLCLRNLKISGTARIDLLHQAGGFVPDLPRQGPPVLCSSRTPARGSPSPSSSSTAGGNGDLALSHLHTLPHVMSRLVV